MIVHQPTITKTDQEVSVSARVDFDKPIEDIPGELWFRFPASYQDDLTDRADGFAAGLLLPAMLLGEDLEVRGTTSPQLYFGLQEIQRIYRIWFPEHFSPIQVHCERLEAMDLRQVQGGFATAFSGGVDSFYTLWDHLESNQPLKDYRITHCLFAQGYDLSLADTGNFELLKEQFHRILSPLGIQLITCQTNIHAFTAQLIRWEAIYGPALAATALVLGRLLNKFAIASVHPYQFLKPTGSTPFSDHLLSSETLEIIHYGAGTSRIEKLAALSSWPTGRENLRVCTDDKKRLGTHNCSRCDKCLRTMSMLKVTGSYEKFTTFDPSFSNMSILRWALKYRSTEPWIQETALYARKNGKTGYLPLLYFVGTFGWLKQAVIRLIPKLLFLRIKRLFYPPEKNIFSHQYVHKRSDNSDTV